jgi:hypothetical protein
MRVKGSNISLHGDSRPPVRLQMMSCTATAQLPEHHRELSEYILVHESMPMQLFQYPTRFLPQPPSPFAFQWSWCITYCNWLRQFTPLQSRHLVASWARRIALPSHLDTIVIDNRPPISSSRNTSPILLTCHQKPISS